MFMKRMMVAAVGFLLLGSTPLVAGSTASADQAAKVIDIKGGDSFQPNAFLLNTFHFDPGLIKVHRGQQLLFHNKTTDGHTMTLVAKADVPRHIADVFHCKLCNFWTLAVEDGSVRATSREQFDLERTSGHLRMATGLRREPPGGV